jgi:hypothetical protein
MAAPRPRSSPGKLLAARRPPVIPPGGSALDRPVHGLTRPGGYHAHVVQTGRGGEGAGSGFAPGDLARASGEWMLVRSERGVIPFLAGDALRLETVEVLVAWNVVAMPGRDGVVAAAAGSRPSAAL